MRRHDPDLVSPVGFQEITGRHDGARRVDHVVDQDAVTSRDVTNDVTGFGDVHCPVRTRLVHQGEVAPEVLGVPLRHLDATGVGCHDDQTVGIGVRLQVLLEYRGSDQMVDGNIEEPLDLARVEVN